MYGATLTSAEDPCGAGVDWRLLAPSTPLNADAHNPIAVTDRLAGYGAIAHGTGNLRRCPGTASQVPPSGDNSAPFLDQGQTQCDPNQRLPGSGGTP